MSEPTYRALAEQMHAARAIASDDAAAALDRSASAYLTAARQLKLAGMREAAARNMRDLSFQHLRLGRRGVSDHFSSQAESLEAAAPVLRDLAAASVAEAEAHYAAATGAQPPSHEDEAGH